MKWNIGDTVKDEDGDIGIVGIRWNDGDFCTIENDAAHPNPTITKPLGDCGHIFKDPNCPNCKGV